MDTVLVYSPRLVSLDIENPADAGCDANYRFLPVSSRVELCHNLVEIDDICGLLIEFERPGAISEEEHRFLASLEKHFPILPIAVISSDPPQSEGLEWISADVDNASLLEQACNFAAHPASANRRAHHRFDWILNGFVTGNDGEEIQCRIRSISAGGAFLETSEILFPPGKEIQLRISFQNFQLHVDCEVLDPRRASSNLPAGIGLSFIRLRPQTTELLDRIVNDTIVQILLNPDEEAEVPSLMEEELTPDCMFL